VSGGFFDAPLWTNVGSLPPPSLIPICFSDSAVLNAELSLVRRASNGKASNGKKSNAHHNISEDPLLDTQQNHYGTDPNAKKRQDDRQRKQVRAFGGSSW
jgi:hypothetical protein